MKLTGRQASIATWIYERFGEYARAHDVFWLDDLELPTGVLLSRLTDVYERYKPRSVNYFFAQLSTLHEWESEWRGREGPRSEDTTPLGDLLREHWTAQF